MKRRRRTDAHTLLLTDEELFAWWEERRADYFEEATQIANRATCASCLTHTGRTVFENCRANHQVCEECFALGQEADVRSCPFCPAPLEHMQVQCKSCSTMQTSLASDCFTCTQCNTTQLSDLIRLFKRNGQYTNVLSAAEYSALQLQFWQSNYSAHCTCGQAISRMTACNELYHCGHQRVCACCSAFTLPWEETLSAHLQTSSQCARHIVEDKLLASMPEQDATALRIKASLQALSLRVR